MLPFHNTHYRHHIHSRPDTYSVCTASLKIESILLADLPGKERLLAVYRFVRSHSNCLKKQTILQTYITQWLSQRPTHYLTDLHKWAFFGKQQLKNFKSKPKWVLKEYEISFFGNLHCFSNGQEDTWCLFHIVVIYCQKKYTKYLPKGKSWRWPNSGAPRGAPYSFFIIIYLFIKGHPI